MTASKDNGDFAITSTEVLHEKHPKLSSAEIGEMLITIGDEYEMQGYKISYSVEDY
jgi:hypothetical protein